MAAQTLVALVFVAACGSALGVAPGLRRQETQKGSVSQLQSFHAAAPSAAPSASPAASPAPSAPSTGPITANKTAEVKSTAPKVEKEAAPAPEDRVLLPVGEGAYQSAKAVEQRTQDPNMHCEDGNWKDCYQAKAGDYADNYEVKAAKAKPSMKSMASSRSMVVACVLSLTLLISFAC